MNPPLLQLPVKVEIPDPPSTFQVPETTVCQDPRLRPIRWNLFDEGVVGVKTGNIFRQSSERSVLSTLYKQTFHGSRLVYGSSTPKILCRGTTPLSPKTLRKVPGRPLVGQEEGQWDRPWGRRPNLTPFLPSVQRVLGLPGTPVATESPLSGDGGTPDCKVPTLPPRASDLTRTDGRSLPFRRNLVSPPVPTRVRPEGRDGTARRDSWCVPPQAGPSR